MSELLLQSQEQLAATVYGPEDAERRVLFVHGWNSDQRSPSACAQALADLGYRCLTFDLSGHGDSGGDKDKFSRSEFLADVIVAYDALVGDSDSVPYVVGASFGAYLSCCLSAKREVSGIALRVPANYPDFGFEDEISAMKEHRQQTEQVYAEYRQQLEAGPIVTTRANRALWGFNKPVLIVESGEDEVIHVNTVLGYRECVLADKLTYLVMEGAPHSIGRTPEYRRQYCSMLVNWFEQVKSQEVALKSSVKA